MWFLRECSLAVPFSFYSPCVVVGNRLHQMLKHGRAGVPMEVMGLMLGEFVDDYTVRCIDVFAMPQVSAEPIFLRGCDWVTVAKPRYICHSNDQPLFPPIAPPLLSQIIGPVGDGGER